ncbi:MAG: (d)CMP kinase [Clostridiales bacterium]|nr:(d)CMP kinase [Clostridiales bacterium]MDY6117554.1 (d)CMP kinase [Anaerovoracaceae bacterium]
MSDILRIAIDGPGGAGKSTVAKAVAKKLGIDYIDTGAMYRAIAYKFMSLGIIPGKDNDAQFQDLINKILASTEVDYSKGITRLDGTDVSDKIRTAEISSTASSFSAFPSVRKKLVSLQQKMAQEKSLVMDGRDIGSNVIKDAELKIFLTASPEERARRRFEELSKKNDKVDYEAVLCDMKIRDRNDMSRQLNPLVKAEDALELDSSNMSVDEVVDLICERAKQLF